MKFLEEFEKETLLHPLHPLRDLADDFHLQSTNSGTVTLTNPGNTTGPVILRVDGPCTGPQIAHIGTGQAITFASSLVLGAGEWLTINLETHQTLANDQANRGKYITSAGWSGFDRGVNVWAFSAAAYDPASKLTVTATPARK